ATANNWNEDRKLAIAKAYIYDNAKDWLKRMEEKIQQYDIGDNDNRFKVKFLEHTIIPVKCYIDIQDRIYPAIIDSKASVSIISHQTVKELGLKIEELSKSLIVATTGTTSRPLEIIRNLLIRIQGQLIPLDVEVVSATSYSILLGNDWLKK
ncbi:25749_t:CDS:2, partial [Racocetra persica]